MCLASRDNSILPGGCATHPTVFPLRCRVPEALLRDSCWNWRDRLRRSHILSILRGKRSLLLRETQRSRFLLLPNRPSARRSFRRTWPYADNAWRSCAIRATGDGVTRSSTAPTADHDSVSFLIFLMIVRSRPCRDFRCVRTVSANITIHPTGGSTHSRMPARSAGRGFSCCRLEQGKQS